MDLCCGDIKGSWGFPDFQSLFSGVSNQLWNVLQFTELPRATQCNAEALSLQRRRKKHTYENSPCFGLRIGNGSPSFQKKYMNVNQTTQAKSSLCLCTEKRGEKTGIIGKFLCLGFMQGCRITTAVSRLCCTEMIKTGAIWHCYCASSIYYRNSYETGQLQMAQSPDRHSQEQGVMQCCLFLGALGQPAPQTILELAHTGRTHAATSLKEMQYA